MKQLHKKFTDDQVKDLITHYLKKKIERKDLQKVLDIKKTRFFALIKRFKDYPENFSVSYFRSTPTHVISKGIETNIIYPRLYRRTTFKIIVLIPTFTGGDFPTD